MSRFKRLCQTAYGKRTSRAAKSNPKAQYNHVKPKATLQKAMSGVENQQGVTSTSSQEKYDCLLEFSRAYRDEISKSRANTRFHQPEVGNAGHSDHEGSAGQPKNVDASKAKGLTGSTQR